jgi:hypothetical protein
MKLSPAQRCLIVFPDDWISYSPTVVYLISTLLEHGVKVCTVYVQSKYEVSAVPGAVAPVRIGKLTQRVLERLGLYGLYRAIRITMRLQFLPPADIALGVDSLGALCVQWAGSGQFDFLSLEVRRDLAFRLLKADRIRHVLIQSPERYDYLFDKRSGSVIYVQNSPILHMPVEARRATSPLRLVYLGNAIAAHGIFECIDLVAADAELRLEICGLVDPEVRVRVAQSGASDRIHLHDEYVEQANIRTYLTRFDVGLCLYNVSEADFNYQSIPSGKLFNYFSAALPVVGTDMIGLRAIRDFAAGELIRSNSVDELHRALEKVRAHYDEYSQGATRAAHHFEFGRMAQPYVDKILRP